MTVFILLSEYHDYDGGSTSHYGYTLDEEFAKKWVVVMTERAQIAHATNREIQNHMNDWVVANPRPAYGTVPDLVKALHKVPKKDRTEAHVVAITAAKQEMERLRQEMCAPMHAWTERWGAERARKTSEYEPSIINDMANLPMSDEFSYQQIEEVV